MSNVELKTLDMNDTVADDIINIDDELIKIEDYIIHHVKRNEECLLLKMLIKLRLMIMKMIL